jgi:hypothetical protein
MPSQNCAAVAARHAASQGLAGDQSASAASCGPCIICRTWLRSQQLPAVACVHERQPQPWLDDTPVTDELVHHAPAGHRKQRQSAGLSSGRCG